MGAWQIGDTSGFFNLDNQIIRDSNMKQFVFSIIVIGMMIVACSEDRVYTLYRDSDIIENARIHVATFDADEKERYNKVNCKSVCELFKSYSDIVEYWCEKGYYKK